MTNPDELERLARAATHQSWAAFTDESGPSPHTNLVSFSPITDCAVSISGVHKNDPNIAFIAAANPATILDLLAANRKMRTALERIADPRNIHFAGDAQVVARSALSTKED